MITQNPLIGRSKKSLGGATATTWKSINVLKSKPVSVANPRSAGQIAQRTKMKNATAVARAIMQDVKLGFKEKAIKMSEYNAFVKKNLSVSVFSSIVGNPLIEDPALMLISDGSIGSSSISAAAGATTTSIKVAPSTSMPVGGDSGDIFRVVVYDESNGLFIPVTYPSTARNVAAAGMVVTGPAAAFDSGNFYVYGYFYNPISGKSSQSTAYNYSA